MSAEDNNLKILEKGRKIYKPGNEFAMEYDELLKLFSLYISFDPDYNYNNSYLFDKIVDFSNEMCGYYNKQQIIEDAIQRWISGISSKQKTFLKNIVILFDEVFQFDGSLSTLKLIKMPSLKEVRANNIKITCHFESPKIMDYEKIILKNDNNRVIEDIVEFLSAFFNKAMQNYSLAEGDYDGK